MALPITRRLLRNRVWPHLERATPGEGHTWRGPHLERATPGEAVSQSGLGRHHEISRWSPNASNLALSTAGDSARGPFDKDNSVGESKANNIASTRSSTMGNTMNNVMAGSIEADRESSLLALEHGGRLAYVSERNAKTQTSNFTQNPGSTQQPSNSAGDQ
ncbi:hypothetical protein AJ78_06372 [Emergomyces pasteurianus Ep9510]|uniref:Uncharacterized protein n=1 Tax=Emergomyces pasteurianus Ep9510 TaxID=1447872 RepID=A0A1J9QD92_9EURO|nr:hypothetical protein AJ78_06372 [Emergomyces pasteurianus Ep9510]